MFSRVVVVWLRLSLTCPSNSRWEKCDNFSQDLSTIFLVPDTCCGYYGVAAGRSLVLPIEERQQVELMSLSGSSLTVPRLMSELRPVTPWRHRLILAVTCVSWVREYSTRPPSGDLRFKGARIRHPSARIENRTAEMRNDD